MSHSPLALLEDFPDGAVQYDQGAVFSLNRTARERFPLLRQGDPLPPCLAQAAEDPQPAGSFVFQGVRYLYSRLPLEQGQLLLFHPAVSPAITPRQLDGFVRQLREFLQQILIQFQLITEHAEGQDAQPGGRIDAFYKSFYRICRLVGNLDCLRSLTGEEPGAFRPVTMDLAGFSRQLCLETASLLQEAGVTLNFRCQSEGLLIAGDGELLSHMMLSLISNAARAAKGGEVTVSLRRRDRLAVLSFSDSGDVPEELFAQLVQPSSQPSTAPAMPGQGAGLGLDIARAVAVLHGGALLLRRQENGSLLCAVSLPLGTADTGPVVRSPRPEEAGGLSAALVELSDLLPARIFHPDLLFL